MWLDRAFGVMNTGVAAWLQTGDARQGNRALDAVERFFLQVEWRLSATGEIHYGYPGPAMFAGGTSEVVTVYVTGP